MEIDWAAQERKEERIASIGVSNTEGWVVKQLFHIFQVSRHIGTSLHAKHHKMMSILQSLDIPEVFHKDTICALSPGKVNGTRFNFS